MMTSAALTAGFKNGGGGVRKDGAPVFKKYKNDDDDDSENEEEDECDDGEAMNQEQDYDEDAAGNTSNEMMTMHENNNNNNNHRSRSNSRSDCSRSRSHSGSTLNNQQQQSDAIKHSSPTGGKLPYFQSANKRQKIEATPAMMPPHLQLPPHLLAAQTAVGLNPQSYLHQHQQQQSQQQSIFSAYAAALAAEHQQQQQHQQMLLGKTAPISPVVPAPAIGLAKPTAAKAPKKCDISNIESLIESRGQDLAVMSGVKLETNESPAKVPNELNALADSQKDMLNALASGAAASGGGASNMPPHLLWYLYALSAQNSANQHQLPPMPSVDVGSSHKSQSPLLTSSSSISSSISPSSDKNKQCDGGGDGDDDEPEAEAENRKDTVSPSSPSSSNLKLSPKHYRSTHRAQPYALKPTSRASRKSDQDEHEQDEREEEEASESLQDEQEAANEHEELSEQDKSASKHLDLSLSFASSDNSNDGAEESTSERHDGLRASLDEQSTAKSINRRKFNKHLNKPAENEPSVEKD